MKFIRNIGSTAAYQNQVKACFKLYEHDICFSKAKPTPQIYAQVANFSGNFHFLPMPTFLCICAGQAVLVKCQCVKATRPREMLFESPCFAARMKNSPDNAPISNLSSPRFQDRAVESSGELLAVLLSQVWKPWFEWTPGSGMPVTRSTDKITKSPRCRSCLKHAIWLSSGSSIKSRLSECGIRRPQGSIS